MYLCCTKKIFCVVRILIQDLSGILMSPFCFKILSENLVPNGVGCQAKSPNLKSQRIWRFGESDNEIKKDALPPLNHN